VGTPRFLAPLDSDVPPPLTHSATEVSASLTMRWMRCRTSSGSRSHASTMACNVGSWGVISGLTAWEWGLCFSVFAEKSLFSRVCWWTENPRVGSSILPLTTSRNARKPRKNKGIGRFLCADDRLAYLVNLAGYGAQMRIKIVVFVSHPIGG
jgi:hypothetical protein